MNGPKAGLLPPTSPRAKLVAEILVPSQKLNPLRRQVSKRPQFSSTDRFLFVWLARLGSLLFLDKIRLVCPVVAEPGVNLCTMKSATRGP
jgi:hypothetical protein